MPSLVGAVKDFDPIAAKIEGGSAVDPGAAQSISPAEGSHNMETEASVKAETSVEVKNSDGKEDPASSQSTDSINDEDATPKSKKRKVTPAEDSESKQTQQEKVKQMSLSSFFLPAKDGAGKSPMAAVTGSAKPAKNSSSGKKRSAAPENGSVLENLPSPRKRPLEERLEENSDDGDEKMKDGDATSKDAEKDSKLPAADDDSKVEEEGAADAKPAVDTAMDISNSGEAESSIDDKKGAKEANDKPEPDVVDLSTESEATKSKPEDGKKGETPAAVAKPAVKPKSTRKRAPKKKSAEQKKEPALPARLEEKDLSEERRSLHQKYQAMKVRYLERSSQLVSQARGGMEEEGYEKQALEPLDENESLDEEDFPTRVVGNMALIVEGRCVLME